MKMPTVVQAGCPARARPRSRRRARSPPSAAAVGPGAGRVGRAAGERDHAGADRGGQEGRQGRLVHLGRPAAGRADRQRVRGEVSGRRGARRAHRRRARVPAHRPGICEQHLRGRRRQLVGRRAFHRVEARRLARALRAGGRGQALSAPSTRTRTACSRASASSSASIGYNTNLVKAAGRAEELRRPARSEMGRQDRQGASGLQRHHPDRDLPDRARHRLGVFREARQAEDHAGAVGVRPAQEARARRARDHGRRHRVRHVPAQGEAASRSRSSIRPKARR